MRAPDEALTHGRAVPGRLIDRFLPEAEFRAYHETLVRAPADMVFEVAENFDLMSVPVVHAILWLRPKILGAPPPGRSDLDGLISRTASMGWGQLGRRPRREVVMGAAVQPWLPEPVFESIPPDRFLAYDGPARVKIAWTLEVEPLSPGLTRFRTETRAQPTDDFAHTKFRRYRRLFGIGIRFVRLFALPALRREAERRATKRTMEVA